ncbi:MAG: hypothetical protein JSR96_02630 [Proteobacteria bacterium]|nr:hypothetical protein [Pseudomonadota bacterium]
MTAHSIETRLEAIGIGRDTFDLWVARQWLVVESGNDGTVVLSGRMQARAGLIRDLQGDLGVNDEGIDVALHLIDQIHALRRALGALENRNPQSADQSDQSS